MKTITKIRIAENIFFVGAAILFNMVDWRLLLGLILYEISMGFAFAREKLRDMEKKGARNN